MPAESARDRHLISIDVIYVAFFVAGDARDHRQIAGTYQQIEQTSVGFTGMSGELEFGSSRMALVSRPSTPEMPDSAFAGGIDGARRAACLQCPR